MIKEYAPESICQEAITLIDSYLESLATYTEELFQYKQAEDVWSLAQMYEHLHTSSTFFMYQVRCCLEQRKGSTEGTMNEHGIKMFSYGTFPPIQIKMPTSWDKVAPQNKQKAECEKLLAQDKVDFQELLPKVLADDGSYKTNHITLGMFRAKDWYKITEMHLRHHLRQKQALESFITKR